MLLLTLHLEDIHSKNITSMNEPINLTDQLWDPIAEYIKNIPKVTISIHIFPTAIITIKETFTTPTEVINALKQIYNSIAEPDNNVPNFKILTENELVIDMLKKYNTTIILDLHTN